MIYVVMIPGIGTRHYCVGCLTDAARKGGDLHGRNAIAEHACCGHKCEPCSRQKKECNK